MTTKTQQEDAMTTILGLAQSLIFQFDLLPKGQTFFKNTLKFAANNFKKECEQIMNQYFILAYKDKGQFEQADVLNQLCNVIDHSTKLAYRMAEMTPLERGLFEDDYEKLMAKFNLESIINQ